MPAANGLPLAQVQTERQVMLTRLKALSTEPQLRAAALERLEARLRTWNGSAIVPSARFKNKVARGSDARCAVGSDEVELLITRALSITAGDCQFTVATNGAVYASDANGWTVNKTRIFIAGLSPLIDDAAEILRQMRWPTGGRMFFDRENTFLNAQNRQPFLEVIIGDMAPTVKFGAAPASAPRRAAEARTCPTCYQVLPVTGECGSC